MCWLILNPLEQHKMVLTLLPEKIYDVFSADCVFILLCLQRPDRFQDHISECVALFTLSAYGVLFEWGKPSALIVFGIDLYKCDTGVFNQNLIIIPLHAPDVCLLTYAARGGQQTNGTQRRLSTTISCLTPHTCSLQSKFPSGDCLFFCIH